MSNDELSDFVNPGYCRLGSMETGLPVSIGAGSRWIVVLGVARGGTSAVASVLAELGVDMGLSARPPVFEDLELAQAIEAGDREEARHIIATRETQSLLLGFKRPSYSHYVNDYHDLFAQPRYVIIFRDLVAIAARANASSSTDVLTSVSDSLNQYQLLHDFINNVSAPILLLSYEKMLQNPAEFVSVIADFAGVEEDASRSANAITAIRPSPESYVDTTRANKSRGRVDVVESTRVIGWAQYLDDRRVATVSILVNGVEVTKINADLFRSDLVSSGISGNGCCAFECVLATPLRDGDSVRARVTDDVRDLMNSPLQFRSSWLNRVKSAIFGKTPSPSKDRSTQEESER